MSESPKVAEAAVKYGATVSDLQEPLILEQEGRPLAVVISFQEYQRLRVLEAEHSQRQQAAWQDLSALVTEIHSRPTEYSSEQIEAEITAAHTEVKEMRRARRRS